mmetsp:Transcript_28005/g.72061  ORF Transcript_28005/g.72061 Transcript_28005/m.72061 type:complete len:121 (-) Transcript_28005:29-391(-)|eukprot:jgi/Tetstr1/429450/TSEL_019358.t1
MATGKNWLFCPRSGALLVLQPSTGKAVCPDCDFTRPLEELRNVSITTASDMEDYRRRYNLEPVVRTDQDVTRQRATTEEDCPKCGHHGLEFYTMQLRSADEGQTVFYECPKCGHKYSQNN